MEYFKIVIGYIGLARSNMFTEWTYRESTVNSGPCLHNFDFIEISVKFSSPSTNIK